MAKLTALRIKTLKDAGRYTDGDGLALIINAKGSRSWVVRVQKDGKRKEFTIGSAKTVTLAQAREQAHLIKMQVAAGIDPNPKDESDAPLFRDAAKVVYEEQRKGWKSQKHQTQWLTVLETYAFPTIGDKTVDEITGPDIRAILITIWQDKHETARRVRQRIVAVLDWAVASGHRENEINLRVINRTLPKPKKPGHFAAMPFKAVPAFISGLHGKSGNGALALRFTILTAARSGETRLATWDEIDETAQTWTIPAERMKADREHVVPLSTPALAVLEEAKAHGSIGLIFEGQRAGRPLSDMTLTKVLRDAEEPFTVHGFRSSFRDWTAEMTSYANETAELALAHSIGNKTEAAYRRGNQLEKRRPMMDDWAEFLAV